MTEKPLLNGVETIALANMLLALRGPVDICCTYTNWRGERAERRLRPLEVWYGNPGWHPTPDLMLRAFDYDKNAERDFRLEHFDVQTLNLAEASDD